MFFYVQKRLLVVDPISIRLSLSLVNVIQSKVDTKHFLLTVNPDLLCSGDRVVHKSHAFPLTNEP